MKNIENLKKIAITKEKAKSIKGGDIGLLLIKACADAITRANKIIDSGFYRCAGGCDEQDTIYLANTCVGRDPWSHEKIGENVFSSLM